MQRRPLALLATAVLAVAVSLSGCGSGTEDGVSVTAGPSTVVVVLFATASVEELNIVKPRPASMPIFSLSQ